MILKYYEKISKAVAVRVLKVQMDKAGTRSVKNGRGAQGAVCHWFYSTCMSTLSRKLLKSLKTSTQE